jgi:hypothetical protein
MNPSWKNSPEVRSLPVLVLALLLVTTSARADQPVSLQEYSVYCVQKTVFPTVEFEDATLETFIEAFRLYTSRLDCERRTNVNVILDTHRLTAAQLSARISIREKDITMEEVLYAVCKGLGIGYRVDAHAVVISSREHAGLPKPPSKRVASVPDGRVTAYVVIVGRDKS